MTDRQKRKKGAQKRNRNALKKGFYSKIFDEAERYDFSFASGIEGIDEEIALLRMEIKKTISGGDERNLILLVKAAGALEKLVRVRYQITAAQRKGLKEAIGNVVKDVLLPLGVNIGGAVVTRKISA
jgi:hypothetical protein